MGNDDALVDEQRRRFLTMGVCALGGAGALCALTPFIASWMPSAKTIEAGAPVYVDLSHMEPGQQLTVVWRGKPVWIIRRTSSMQAHVNAYLTQLRDPNSQVEQQPEYARNPVRSIHPEYLVLIGVCTHLGCSPHYKPNDTTLGPDWPGGFYCPCHGSRFDLSGRVFKSMPAPINMEVPPHRFINDQLIVIGEDAHA